MNIRVLSVLVLSLLVTACAHTGDLRDGGNNNSSRSNESELRDGAGNNNSARSNEEELMAGDKEVDEDFDQDEIGAAGNNNTSRSNESELSNDTSGGDEISDGGEEVEVEVEVEEPFVWEDGTYMVDLAQSQLLWEGSKIIGGSHNGYIPLIEGGFIIKGGEVEKGGVKFDMSNLKATDIDSPKLDDHLKAEDFFHTAKYPQGRFVITNLDGALVKGDLKIKEFDRPVIMGLTIIEEGDDVRIQGMVVLEKDMWGITNKLVKSEIPVNFDLIVQRQ